ncbi:MAG TPA: sigma-70 family RNA polymerase sigma factor [Thermoanaerobaculia bacterium]|nr:sigma-70 family RNA polymerase sigma factor [Thermoanaerobaculia bacterium]
MTDLAALYERHAKDVYRFALFLTGDRADADDIVSETFLKVWTARDDLRLETVRGYLFAIARNIHLHARRRAWRFRPLPEELPDVAAGPAETAEGKIALDALRTGLRELPEPDRAAVLMRACGGISYREIAAALGVSETAARVRVHRARARLARGRPGKEKP